MSADPVTVGLSIAGYIGGMMATTALMTFTLGRKYMRNFEYNPGAIIGPLFWPLTIVFMSQLLIIKITPELDEVRALITKRRTEQERRRLELSKPPEDTLAKVIDSCYSERVS